MTVIPTTRGLLAAESDGLHGALSWATGEAVEDAT